MARASQASGGKRSSTKASAARRSGSNPGRAKRPAARAGHAAAGSRPAAKKSSSRSAKSGAAKAAARTKAAAKPKAATQGAARPKAKTRTKAAAKPAAAGKPKPAAAAAKPRPKSRPAAPAKAAPKPQSRAAAASTPAGDAKASTKRPAPARRPAAAAQPAEAPQNGTAAGAAAWTPVTSTPAARSKRKWEVKQAPKKFQRNYKVWLQRLLRLRRQLLGETSQLEEEALKAGEHDVSIDHMADYGSDSYEQEFTLSLIESKSEALRDVDEAIRRIDAGSYGLCEECDTLIPRERLEVLPHTRLCIACKSAQESAAGY